MNSFTTTSNPILEEKQMRRWFEMLKASIERSRTSITAIFLSVFNQQIVQEENRDVVVEKINLFLQSKIRQSDFLFNFENSLEWCIMLSYSGEGEANAFLQRLFLDIKSNKEITFDTLHLSFSASVVEIGNSDVAFNKLIETGKESLNHAVQIGAWQIQYRQEYKQRKIETIKVSILEENDILRFALLTSLEKIKMDDIELEIQTFEDGYQFLQSNRYISSHSHILIMNDILPKKNGMEVLHAIRKLPNNRKFVVIMMTKRKSEEDMIYAYENGVDLYLIKPFNLRLFEAQVKRVFERFWS